MRRRTPRRQAALTLIEVLSVVVILGMLAATLAVGFSGALGKGKRELARTAIGQIVAKLELYWMENGTWPGEMGLNALTDGQASPAAPYYLAPDRLVDPWGAPYYLVVPGPDGHPYEVVSYGADRMPGGDGENADLTSTKLRG